MVSKRKHISLSAAEIREKIDNNENNISLLKELLHEISYRKKAQKHLAAYAEKVKSILAKSDPTKSKANEEVIKSRDSSVNSSEIEENISNPPKEEAKQKFEDLLNDAKPQRENLSKEIGKLGKIRKASINLKSLPQVWSPELKNTFQVRGLDEAETYGEKFKYALSALIWEIRKGAKFSKTIYLNNGQRQKNISGEFGYIYAFPYSGEDDFFEGAAIDIRTDNKRTKGSIVSILRGTPSTLLVSIDEDFGDKIANCTLTQDEAALLEVLHDRLEIEVGLGDSKRSPVGMNTELANLLMEGKSELLAEEDQKPTDISILNSGQAKFVKTALKYSISFLWGPPGTGKTQSLGAIAVDLYSRNERTLICSNTNQAVDQVLLKLCREMIQQGRLDELEDGKIVRVGRVFQQDLVSEFSEYVTVDGIAARKGSEITAKINDLEGKASISEKKCIKFEKIIDGFDNLEDLETSKKNVVENINELKRKIDDSLLNRHNLSTDLEKYLGEKAALSTKGFLGKAFSRNPDKIEADIQTTRNRLTEKEQSIELLTQELNQSKSENESYTSKISRAKKALAEYSLSEVKEEFNTEDRRLSEINAEIMLLRKQLDDLRKTILSNAIIIGSTLTKSFLSPSDLGKYSNVIIDEASMCLLPAVYFTASQSSKRCIISGDFRQLPPIVQSKNKMILDLIGTDIFSFSGIEESFSKKTDCPYADLLSEQYRMDSRICDLISEIGYQGDLFTSKDRVADKLNYPELFNDSVIIVDTSPIYPFTDRDPFGSTSNLVHALITRNILRQFIDFPNSGSIGYCAPFRAQTKLVKKMLGDDQNLKEVSIGTIHTFQGDEKNTIIFDTVDSLGEKHYLNPNLAQEGASESNLLTVGVSRAQNKLIFIANLRYLDTKIPALGYLRKILYSAQDNGTVVDARKIIDLAPFNEEIEKAAFTFEDLKVSPEQLKSGLVNEDSFFPLLKQDLSRAKRYIAIYSGFYTANRVGDLLPILLGKLAEGIKIKIVIPPPSRNGSISYEDSEMIAEKIESFGILVEFRAKIHQKVVLVDEDVAWFGSLNPLSFSGRTEEAMLRINQDGVTSTFSANMAVNRNFVKEDASFIVKPELPVCEFCGGKVFFNRGKFGSYAECLVCQKRKSLKGF